jgi:iron complex outermembrane recepter protein
MRVRARPRKPDHGVAKLALLVLVQFTLAGGVDAEDDAGKPPAPVAGVTVIGVSPLSGAGVDIDKTPTNIQSLSSAGLALEGSPSLIGALGDQLGSVSINDNLDDPFQPDILLRGFEASPVLGTPQGIAVYQSGARVNEAFGETVNWDLIPDLAIRRLDVLGASPVFGLNALGGAIVIDMKTGFTDPGGDATISGGSFGRREASAEFGANNGALGVYLAARGLNEDGWREFSPDRLRQFYGDVSARTGKLTLDLSLTAADNRLSGESATPVQELAVSRALVFTSPQMNDDRLAFVTLNGAYAATSTFSLETGLYYRGFRQSVVNGNTTDYTTCLGPSDLSRLCQADGLTPLSDISGRPIPDISRGGALPIGEIDFEEIASDGVGGSVQATSTAPLGAKENHLSVGASIDHASTDFSSRAEVGVINSALQVMASGLFVDTPENTPFSATPVSLDASSTYLGLYATDTFNVTPRLAVTASGRYNLARIDLADRRGTNLDGANQYRRFNPAIGAAWKVGSAVTVYGGYSEGARTPNASEIECSNPAIPCLLPSSLASDPPTLKQVISHTWEAGLRGALAALGGGTLAWNAGLFRTDVDDDIYGVATSLSAGFFQNIGGTRRAGVELGARYHSARLTAWASYSFVDATFQAVLTLPSPSNPSQDGAGDIQVRPGDRLPGIPRHRLKAGADYEVHKGWTVGGSVAWVSDQFYRGDEGNQLAPLPGYAVVNLHSALRVGRAISLFVIVDNALNARYATFGVLGDPTGVGAPGVPAGGVTNGPGVDNRFQSPTAPIAAYGGVKVRF